MKSLKCQPIEMPSVAHPQLPQYPYGVRLYLDEDTLKKLGISELPALGVSLNLIARVEVVAVSEAESKEGGVRRSLDLQITDMELVSKKSVTAEDMYESEEEKEEEMYGKDGDEKSQSYYMVDQPDPEYMNTAHKRGVRA